MRRRMRPHSCRRSNEMLHDGLRNGKKENLLLRIWEGINHSLFSFLIWTYLNVFPFTPYRLGNDAFRKKEYEKAISMYSKAIDHVKDSSVLYNNRALSYIQLGLPKKAIIDVDFVIQKLDEKNVRSWLYRANGYYLLGEMRDFEKSVNEAKKNNPKELEFIEKAVAQILKSNAAEETVAAKWHAATRYCMHMHTVTRAQSQSVKCQTKRQKN